MTRSYWLARAGSAHGGGGHLKRLKKFCGGTASRCATAHWLGGKRWVKAGGQASSRRGGRGSAHSGCRHREAAQSGRTSICLMPTTATGTWGGWRRRLRWAIAIALRSLRGRGLVRVEVVSLATHYSQSDLNGFQLDLGCALVSLVTTPAEYHGPFVNARTPAPRVPTTPKFRVRIIIRFCRRFISGSSH